MIRAVIDTNLVISSFFWEGLPSHLLLAVQQKQFTAITSELLLAELARVVARPKFRRRLSALAVTAESVVTQYRLVVEVVEPAAIGPVILNDPTDDAVLACAVAGDAQYIISGDAHLLALQSYQQIRILPAHSFLQDILNR